VTNHYCMFRIQWLF